MNIKNFFKRFWSKIKALFGALDDHLKQYVPLAINAAEKVKEAVNNGTYDSIAVIVEAIVPGNAEDPIIATLKVYLEKNLPKLITNLQLVDIVSNYETLDEAYKAIIELLKGSGESTQDATYAEFAQLVLDYLADGKLTRAERTSLIEYYYTNITKKQ